MSAHLPVVVTRGCGLADFVTRHGAGIVTDGTVDALRAALCELLADTERLRAMGAAGAEAARRELSLDALGARLENLYRSVVVGGASPARTMIPVEP